MKKLTKMLYISSLFVFAGLLLTGCQTQTPTASQDKVYRIGISQFADHPSLDNCRTGFIEGLKQEGFVEGKNLNIEYQNAQADIGTSNQIAQIYASKKMDLIGAIATPAAQAAFNAAEAKHIPVVYTAVSDPIGAKLAAVDGAKATLATGTSDELPLEKQVAMIREFLPEAKTIGVLYNLSEVNSVTHIKKLESIAPKYNFKLVTQSVNSSADIPMALDALLAEVDCITNLTDNLVVSSLSLILDKAGSKHIPVFGSEIEQVKKGALASESIDYYQLGIQTGKIAARILKGEQADQIPFETIQESQLVVNQEAVTKLGIKLPASLEATAKFVSK